jgi:DNA-binding transcriptional regulator YiaG
MMQPPPLIVLTSNEARITIVIKFIRSNANLTQRAAAHAYIVPKSTLNDQNHKQPS